MSVEAPLAAGSSALARLRSATRPQHERIEASLDLMRPDVDLHAYRRFIERSFGFISGCERALDVQGAPEALSLRRRLKTEVLRENLRALGVSDGEIGALARPRRLPCVGKWPHALGYLYVIEGSTLGGQVLGRHFRARLGLSDRQLGFVLSYGANTGAMWKAMLHVLDAALADALAEAAIISAASETFEMLTEWHLG